MWSQAYNNPQLEMRWLANKQVFEAELLNRRGIQYVVEVDAMESPSFFNGPQGQEFSHLWVMRKQDRYGGERNEYQVLDYYYIVEGAIFQAPRVENILNYRMMNSLLAIDNVVKAASELPVFSASHGHTYFHPGQKSAIPAIGTDVRQSRAGTPMPSSDAAAVGTQDIAIDPHSNEQQSDERTLREALRLTMVHGGIFYDDAPLIGEPGNFRYASAKDPVSSLKVGDARRTISTAPSKAGTPAPIQAVKPASTPLGMNGSPKANDIVEAMKPKPKRKKSMAANDG